MFSATVKGLLGGHETLLTVRGQSADAFKRNLQAIKGLLDTPATPAPAPRPQAPAQGGVAEDAGWCQVHNTAMRRITKNGRSWLSHWCDSEGRYCHGR
jgi:hypothetical protein